MQKILLIGFLIISSIVSADINKSVAVCAALNDSVKRLDCFDSLAKKEGLAEETTQTKTDSKWVMEESHSKIDDSRKVVIALKSSNEIEGRLSRLAPRTLILRCLENKTSVIVGLNMFLGSDPIRVTQRFDKKKATKRRWDLSTDHEAMFHRKPIGFIREIMKHKKLLLELIPYNESPRLLEFDISGLSNVIKPLQEACHWK